MSEFVCNIDWDVVARVVDTLAWPLLVAGLACMFKKPIFDVFKAIESIKLKVGESEVEAKLKEITSVTDAAAKSSRVNPPQAVESGEKPRGDEVLTFVEDARAKFEQALTTRKHGPWSRGRPSWSSRYAQVYGASANSEIVELIAEFYDELRQFRTNWNQMKPTSAAALAEALATQILVAEAHVSAVAPVRDHLGTPAQPA